MEEKELKDAMNMLGLEFKEVSRRDLDLSYMALKDKYKDNIDYLNKISNAYSLLIKDIRITNELIRNINNPDEKTYVYLENKEEVNKNNSINDNVIKNDKTVPFPGEIKVVDKPNLLIFILSLLAPFYGILNYSFLKKIMPKSSKFYLIAGILGFIIYFGLLFYIAIM